MKRRLICFVLTVVLAGYDFCSDVHGAEAPSTEPSPSAGDLLLADVRARLPREPLVIEGELFVRRRKGLVVQDLKFRMHLDWGGEPGVAVYTILDAFGLPREQLTIKRYPGAPPTMSYATGDPPVAAPVPPLWSTIGKSDISWLDLSLSFLWWDGGKIVGTETVKGRPCYVVDIRAPDRLRNDRKEDVATESPYDSVRLWIDRKMRMLLQAEGRGPGGGTIRTLWVKSLKKVDERWIIKDMEIEEAPALQRTKLRIHEVRSPNNAS